MNAKILMVMITIISITYPIIVYFGLQHFSPTLVASLLLLVMTLRLILNKKSNKPWVKWSLGLGCLLLLFSALLNDGQLIRYYPVVINFSLMTVFVTSLIKPPSVIETLARITDPNLPPQGVKYTEKVTLVWAIFFLINGLIAAYTAMFMTLAHWSLYNGLIAYILIALLFGIEYLVRRKVKAGYQQQL